MTSGEQQTLMLNKAINRISGAKLDAHIVLATDAKDGLNYAHVMSSLKGDAEQLIYALSNAMQNDPDLKEIVVSSLLANQFLGGDDNA